MTEAVSQSEELPPPPPPSPPPPEFNRESLDADTHYQNYQAPEDAQPDYNTWQMDPSQQSAYPVPYMPEHMAGYGQEYTQQAYIAPLPPAKRQKTGNASFASPKYLCHQLENDKIKE